jgi:beta-mannosidase
LKTSKRKKAFEDVFYKLLPSVVERLDGVTSYWPGSPHNPEGYAKGHNNERGGDAHFWDVWHSRKPVKTYEQKKFRFCSEFGMQSYSSPELAKTFCDPKDFNVFGPAMENHQKNGSGNLIILDYVSRLYRLPKDYASLSYLSQLNQAHCMRIGVEHFRRSMPRTMGALYWQINDCWPVFSWSSLEFGGAWKALHHHARRFYAPALVSAHLPGDEWPNSVNQVQTNIRDVEVFTIYEGREALKADLTWALYHIDGGLLKRGTKRVSLRFGQSLKQMRLDFGKELKRWGHRKLVLRLALSSGARLLSQNSVLFTAPRFIDFQRAPIDTQLRRLGPASYELELKSKAFHHQVRWDFPGLKSRGSDNYFDLFPGLACRVQLNLDHNLPLRIVSKKLRVISLVDTY